MAHGFLNGSNNDNYNLGYNDGKQAEYDAIWDDLQNNGNRTDYRSFFINFLSTRIDPKHFIRASNADSIMGHCSNLESVNWDKFDLSAPSSLYSAFGYSRKLKYVDTDLGIISTNTVATVLNSTFRECNSLERVQKVTARPEFVWKQTFDGCAELREIRFDGIIGSNGLNLQWSTKLSRASIESIINALSDTTSGLSITLSLAAVNHAFAYEGGPDDGSINMPWILLVESKPNWAINLV